MSVYGGVAPVVVALVIWLRVERRISRGAGRAARRSEEPGRAQLTLLPSASGWEALTEEIARRGNRRFRRRSDAALRRRHLAAVIPADARR